MAIVLSLAIAFFAAEVTLRLTQPPVDLGVLTGKKGGKHPMAGWANVDAFCAYRAKPGDYPNGRSDKTVNKHGFISTPEIDHAKSPGTVRIVFLGGSSTACNELGDKETWPALATEKLRAALPDKKIEFINGALGGYTTFESYGRLWSRLRFFDPDLVVVYHGWNELYYFKNPSAAARWRVPRGDDWGFDQSVRLIRIKPHPIDPFIEWSSLLCRIRRQWYSEPLRETGEAVALATSWDPEAPEIFRQNLRLFVSAQEALGFELLVVKQATLIAPGLSAELQGLCRYELHGFDHEAHLRAFDALYSVIDEEVPAAQIIDATPLSGNKNHFGDHIHLSAGGARALADLVARDVVPHLVDLPEPSNMPRPRR